MKLGIWYASYHSHKWNSTFLFAKDLGLHPVLVVITVAANYKWINLSFMFGANPATAEPFATSSNISNSVRTLVSMSVYLCALLSAQGIMVDRGEMWRKTMKVETLSHLVSLSKTSPRAFDLTMREICFQDSLDANDLMRVNNMYVYKYIYKYIYIYMCTYIYQWNWRSLKGSLFAACQPSRSSSFFNSSSALKSNPTNSVISSMNSPSRSTAPEQEFTESTY